MKKYLKSTLLMCFFAAFFFFVNVQRADAAVSLQEPKIVSINAPADVTTALRVTWQPVEAADGYIIYRRDEASAQWVRIKKVAGQTKSYYSNVQLQPGSKYTYTVQSFCQVDGKVYYSTKGTNPVSAVTHLKTPALKSAASESYNQIKVVWTPVTNAQGYRIYRKETGTGWKLIRRIAGEKKYFCIDSTAETGKQYYYTVRATCSRDGKLYLSGYNTKGIAGKAVLGASAITSISLDNNDQVTLKWKSVPGANGYVIQKSNAQNGTYKKIKTIQSGSTLSWSGKINPGETAYFRIRAYRQSSNGQFTYGAFSSVKQVASKNVEITRYVDNGYEGTTTTVAKVKRLANAIGGMQEYSVSGFNYVAENEMTGIYVGTEFDMANGIYNLIIDTIDPKLMFHGLKVGDTEASAAAKLKTAGFIDGGYNPQGYEVFVHQTKAELVFVESHGGVVFTYQYAAIDPNLIGTYSYGVMPRTYMAYVR